MLNIHDQKYKEFLKLQKRLNELREKLSKLPNIKLDKPYQKGWIISYDLREDIKRRADFKEIKQCVDMGWSDSYTNNVNVVRAIRKNDDKSIIKSRFGSLNTISDYYPRRSDVPADKIDLKANRWFVLNTTSERYIKYQRKEYYCSVPMFYLVLKVKPNMITHKRQRGGEMQSEHDCLLQRLYWSGEFSSFTVDYSKSYPAHKDRAATRDKIQKFINGDAEDIFNNKVRLEYEH